MKEVDYKKLKSNATDGYNKTIDFIKKHPVESAVLSLVAGFCIGKMCEKSKHIFKK